MKNLLPIFALIGCALFGHISHAQTHGFEKFSKVSILSEFAPILAKTDLNLENGGGKIVTMSDGSMWLVAIGVTVVKPEGGPMETLRQRKVATAKAHSAAIEEMKGASVESTSTSTTTMAVTTQNGIQSGTSTDSLSDCVTTRSEGVTHDMEQAGTWYSASGDIFYLAMCQRLK
jgi:hypothetical protein